MTTRQIVVGVLTGLLVVSSAVAQTRRIDSRQQRQQKRIAHGVQNGSLTPQETFKLEKQEAVLDKKINRMAEDGLTNREKARIEHQQDQMSQRIAREKHDNQVQPPVTGPISARQHRQQQRIGQGIANGSLTPAEAARLEKQEARLNREIRQERRDGGGLNAAERGRIKRQQNSMSRRIHRQKHDGQRRQ